MKPYQFIIIASVLLLLCLVLFFILFIKNKKQNNGNKEYPNLLQAFGGKQNILELSYKGSRINVVVNDKKIVDKEKIKAEGIDTIVVSNKKVTIVVDNKISESIYNYLNNSQ